MAQVYEKVALEIHNLPSLKELWEVVKPTPPPPPSSRPLNAGRSRRKTRSKSGNLAAHLVARWGQSLDLTSPYNPSLIRRVATSPCDSYSRLFLSDHSLAVLEALLRLSRSSPSTRTVFALSALLPFVPGVRQHLQVLKSFGLVCVHKPPVSILSPPAGRYALTRTGLLVRTPVVRPQPFWTCTRLARFHPPA